MLQAPSDNVTAGYCVLYLSYLEAELAKGVSNIGESVRADLGNRISFFKDVGSRGPSVFTLQSRVCDNAVPAAFRVGEAWGAGESYVSNRIGDSDDGAAICAGDSVGNTKVGASERSAIVGESVYGREYNAHNDTSTSGELLGGGNGKLDPHGVDDRNAGIDGGFGGESECKENRVFCDVELKRERNRRNRQEKKERKKKRQAMSIDWRRARSGDSQQKASQNGVVNSGSVVESAGAVSPLRASLESKWIAENELAVLKARRQHAILSANDVDADVRKYRTAVCVATERNMVAIEKAHERLKATGNSTVDDDDRVHTIVGGDTPSLSSGSISPNSSASLSEFRQLAKEKADIQDEKDRLERALESLGLSLEAIEKRGKSVWTDNDHNHELLGELCPDGYGMDRDFCEPGKFRVC